MTDEEWTRRAAALSRVETDWDELLREDPVEARGQTWDALYSRVSLEAIRALGGFPLYSDEEWR